MTEVRGDGPSSDRRGTVGMGTMDFRLLGPFEVWRDGAPLSLGGRRQRAVLALLAMHVGTVVSTDRIVEEIWADAPPPSALRTLHSYVSRLRSTLRDDGADPLVRREPGYVLDLDPSVVDAVRFERLVQEAAACGGARRWPTSPTSRSPPPRAAGSTSAASRRSSCGSTPT